jgi:hypothetical protein
MHDPLHPPRALRWLLFANVATTVMHYVDNLVFFRDYPEPPWMKPHAASP